MEIILPEFCLVLLIGLAANSKAAFIKKFFQRDTVISLKSCRALLSEEENEQTENSIKAGYELLCQITDQRLRDHQFTVIDAPLLRAERRKLLKTIAKKNHCKVVAILFNAAGEHPARQDTITPERWTEQQMCLQVALKEIPKEHYHGFFALQSSEDITAVTFKHPLLDQRQEHGPFDIIGDIHGCFTELCSLLKKLGYNINESLLGTKNLAVSHPYNRKVVFLGDLVDRGPHSLKVVSLVQNMVTHNVAFCVQGNHDAKFVRFLKGKNVQLTGGLEITAQECKTLSNNKKIELAQFLNELPHHYLFDEGRLVVAHAGLPERLQGRDSPKALAFALYGDPTGEISENGLPVRRDWAKDYQGSAVVVYGHTPVAKAEWINNTICLDTGCVFGGELTALRYPEGELVVVPALKKYAFSPSTNF